MDDISLRLLVLAIKNGFETIHNEILIKYAYDIGLMPKKEYEEYLVQQMEQVKNDATE